LIARYVHCELGGAVGRSGDTTSVATGCSAAAPCMGLEFLGYAVCFAGLVYREVLRRLLPVEPSILEAFVVGAIAQLASASAIWIVQRTTGMDIPHSQ
jgi:hypothetical protein